MNIINKQKFLAELGRLLTFMYEDDRRMALAMYSDMFDSCRDEDALIQSLGSPTRQAVAVARNYDAKARKLQLSSGQAATGEIPTFMATIGDIMDEALEDNKRVGPVDENQFSLFQDDGQPHIEFEQEAAPAVSSEEAPAASPSVEESAAASPENAAVTVDDFLAGILDGKPASEDIQPVPAQEPAKETAEPAPDSQDPVDRFIADFSFDPDKPETVEEPEPARSDEVVQDESGSDEVYPSLYNEDDFYTEPVRKANPILLIIYIIAAVPLSLIGIAVLLALAVIALALATACVVGGLFVFSAGLSTLAMIADLMVVLGAGVALFALGLLFLWTAIWLVGGGIAGLIRGVCTLARKWCYKEVEQ